MYLNFLGSLLSYLYVNINNFLGQFSRRPEQKTADWYKLRSDIIGGSELKPFMSDNWEESTISIMNKKLGFTVVNYDIPACHWGNLFEACTERLVEISLGCKVIGNNSNIPAPIGSGLEKIHANSPDGIGVISYYINKDNDAELLTTDTATQIDALYSEIKSYTVVFEFKSTVSRVPTDEIPTIYLPQVWSGLTCVPIADFGLFVDVVYRLCDRDDLLSNSNYNSEYHSDIRNLSEEILEHRLPVALGLTAIYAPRMNTPDDKLMYKIPVYNPNKLYETVLDPKHEAYTLSMTISHGYDISNNQKTQNFEPIDFGGLDSGNGCDVKQTINKVLSMIDKKYFIHTNTDPCFMDGRGCVKLLTDEGIDEIIEEFKQTAPDGYYLLGYFPWKVFDIRYIPEERNPDFLPLIAPRLKKFMAEYNRIKSSDNPRKEFEKYRDDLTINTTHGKAKQQKSIDNIMKLINMSDDPI
jgi:hypothetical protein